MKIFCILSTFVALLLSFINWNMISKQKSNLEIIAGMKPENKKMLIPYECLPFYDNQLENGLKISNVGNVLNDNLVLIYKDGKQEKIVKTDCGELHLYKDFLNQQRFYNAITPKKPIQNEINITK